MKFHHRVALGLLLGTAIGAYFGPKAVVLEPLGTLFVKAIRMVVVPLIASSLIAAIAALPAKSVLGRMGLRAFGFLFTSLVTALVLGIVFAAVLAPGRSLDPEARAVLVASSDAPRLDPDATPERPSILQMLLDVVPENPIAAAVEGNVLQVLVVSLLLGLAASTLPEEKRRPLADVARSLSETLFKVTAWILQIAPLGVLGIMAAVVGRSGLSVLRILAVYVLVVMLALVFHVVVVYGGVLFLVARGRLGRFVDAARPPALLTFATCSTAAALPVSMRTMQEEGLASPKVASFVLPLGAAIGRDGSAIYQAISVLFIAQVYGVSLGMAGFVTLIVTAVFSALAVASVPAASFINLQIILASLGLPLEGGALVFGVERPLDMARSTVNLLGHLVNAVFTEKGADSDAGGDAQLGDFETTPRGGL